ncbi:MAG: sulfotransferase, partial [Phycisphaerales bacterium]|nr:sulfotransferase [Phycisphaerales bacterium]
DDPDIRAEVALFELGSRTREVVERLSGLAAAHPANPRVWHRLGEAMLASGDIPGAIRALGEARSIAPEDPEIANDLAGAHYIHGRFREAIPLFREAVEKIRNPLIHLNLATALRNEGRFEEAATEIERAKDLNGPFAAVARIEAELEEVLGHDERALQIVEEALARAPGDASLVSVMARLVRKSDKAETCVAMIRKILASGRATVDESVRLLYAASKLLEDAKRYDESFQCLKRANDASRPSWYKPESLVKMNDAMIEAFSPSKMASYARSTCADDRTIFVVGMPRSGTSLVEQIVASHPEAYGAGERNELLTMVRTLRDTFDLEAPYPMGMGELTTEHLDACAEEYLAYQPSDARRVIDKMPHNHAHLPFIECMLPKARIVHCVRHPMDTCFSIYATMLASMHGYAFDLATLGHAYLEYQRLMAAWEAVVSLPILTVTYEEMVRDQEGQTRRLIEFCGLDWDDACLSPHRSRHITRTASMHQVRQPMYTSSLMRHEHFIRHLGPLQEALGA